MRLDRKKDSILKLKDSKIVKKIMEVVNKDGFYLALFICFCIISVAAVWTVKNNISRIENINEKSNIEFVKNQENDSLAISEENAQPVQGDTLDEPEVPVVVISDGSNEVTNLDGEAANTNDHETKVLSNRPVLTNPVEGQACLDYAAETLVYSKTLDQFVIHKGIDIEAPLNTPVCAAADGTVIKVEEDEKMGISISVQHDNDIVTVYSNLSTTEMVAEGDFVKQGDVISGVGETALFEILEVPHLHFEVLNSGENENPKNFLK